MQVSRGRCSTDFKDKEDIFSAVFRHWLMARLPDAQAAAERSGNAQERLLDVCRAVAVEPWREMFGAPMASEFIDACNRIDPEAAACTIVESPPIAWRRCLTTGQRPKSSFMLALDGLLADDPQGTSSRIVSWCSRPALAADLGAAALYAQQAPREASEARDICLVGNVAHPYIARTGLLSNDPMVRQPPVYDRFRAFRTVSRKATVVQGRNVRIGAKD